MGGGGQCVGWVFPCLGWLYPSTTPILVLGTVVRVGEHLWSQSQTILALVKLQGSDLVEYLLDT